jgi:hypothetical protein
MIRKILSQRYLTLTQFFVLKNVVCSHFIIIVYLCLLFFQDHPSFSSLPPLPKEGPLPEESALGDNEAPEATERRDKDDVEDSVERTESNQLPPSANTQGKEEGRKRKRQEDLKSLGTLKS